MIAPTTNAAAGAVAGIAAKQKPPASAVPTARKGAATVMETPPTSPTSLMPQFTEEAAGKHKEQRPVLSFVLWGCILLFAAFYHR